MIMPLDDLIAFQGNRYAFTKAAMIAVEKKGNIKEYPEDGDKKLVSNILNLLLRERVKYKVNNE